MAEHTFHLTPHASGRLYQFISSPVIRLIQLRIQLRFTLLAILFFSVGVGHASKYVENFTHTGTWALTMTFAKSSHWA